MWRSLFLAIGISLCILGVESLAVESAVLRRGAEASSGDEKPRVVQLPDWAPWGLLSGGAVVILYSFSIPARQHKD